MADKEWNRVLKERNKAEADFKLNEQFKFDTALADAAVQNRITELTTITPGEKLTLEVRYPDPADRQKAADDFLANKLKENKAEIDALGAMWQHKNPSYYEQMATGIFKQTPDLKFLLSLETGETIKTENLSESDANYLRSKWCVAVSTWGMLKRNYGDAIPDFTKFVKDMVDLKFINPSNMELATANGGTKDIVNHYAKPNGGNFDRVSLEDKGSRSARYEALASDLIKNRPEAITLRVKEVDEKGHTISLQRNLDGKTYTVIDTSQSEINGTQFDPENFENSELGNAQSESNPYKEFLPKAYDYVK
ncbi:hypothetical protein JWG40_10050 [Leptospira sp. 201903074]|uniref:hypothetical protein n=1 Tax=Leptospira abararensis TaxID=2810036 RepID=UPI0019629DA8|nr:hypothetical protein [Leptospira abararensis]MBM9547359.1 hypothetical protein [Leptospira abararensis]